MNDPDDRPAAVGLVRHPPGTGAADRAWARSLVVRHAALHRWRLVAVYELGDDGAGNGDVLDRLRDLAARRRVDVLVVDGLPAALAEALARGLGLRLAGVGVPVRPPGRR